MADTIDVSVERGVARVMLDRPSVRNAFNARMIEELTTAFDALARDETVRVMVLGGNGRSFSAGADADWMKSSLEFSHEQNVADALRMSDMFAAIDRVPQPVVCRVHGASLGGGLGLMAACDIVVAEESTLFGFTEAKLGLAPAVISRFVLKKIGPSWARALYLTAERFGVEVARQIHLVHWIASEANLDRLVASKVQEILSNAPLAVRDAKQLISEATGRSDADLREMTSELIARVRTRPEGQEGLRAFLEKRAPNWRESEPD